MIKPLQSQAIGLAVSFTTGVVVFVVIAVVLRITLGFWHLSFLVGIPLGSMAAFELFTRDRYDVPTTYIGIGKFFGSLTGILFGDGKHWVPPFMEILAFPGPKEKFVLEIPGEKIEAKDGAPIYFGITENGGAANQIQYSITDPLKYIVTDDPEKELCEAYMEAARMFFRQAAEVAGMRNEGRLFPDFLMLTSEDAAFETRLKTTMFKDGDVEEKRLFDKDAVRVLMKEAGTFTKKAASWGIGNIVAFVPNVRENPTAQAAAEERQVAEGKAAALKVKVDSLKNHAGEIKDLGATPDLVLATLLKLSGEDVNIQHINYSGLGNTPVIVGLGNNNSLMGQPRKEGGKNGNR